MKHSVFQRSLAWLIAVIMLLGTLPLLSPMQAAASESAPFEKIVIFNGGSAGKTVKRTAGQHVEFSHQNFNLEIPTTLENDTLTCCIPTRRDDMEGRADVAEEVIRVFGYDHVVGTKMRGEVHRGTLLPERIKADRIKHICIFRTVFPVKPRQFQQPLRKQFSLFFFIK